MSTCRECNWAGHTAIHWGQQLTRCTLHERSNKSTHTCSDFEPADEIEDCLWCEGTGEGRADGAICTHCNGTGNRT